MTFERDPEEMGSESYDDTELRMDVMDSIHEYSPGPDGRCAEHLIRHGAQGAVCGMRRSSVFHVDEEADHRERHWHGGGDCMCFEMDD